MARAATSLWSTLRRDPVVRLTGLCYLVAVLLLVLPVLPAATLGELSAYYLDLPFLFLVLAAFRHRLRGRDPGERRFWDLLSLGFLFWLFREVLYIGGRRMAEDGFAYFIVEDTLYVLLYLCLFFALEARPDLRARDTPGARADFLRTLGSLVFAFGLLTYLAIIPGAAGSDSGDSTVPALLLYAVLDGYLVLRLLSLRYAAGSARWRIVYTWLLAMAGLWLLTDIVEALMWAEVLPWVNDGTPLDLFWMLAYAPAVVAARSREHPDTAAQDQEVRSDPLRGLWGGHLVLFAMAFPLVHFLLDASSLLNPALKPAREACTLFFLLLLSYLAFLQQRQLQRQNERLESEREKALESAQHQAYHDVLTGLANRHLLLDRLQLALAQARRQQAKVAVLFCDLDGFKAINDTLGHPTGDRLLMAVAQRLDESLRQGDTLARLGGDEFTIVLQGVQRASDAAKVARKLSEEMQQPFRVGERELIVTMSVGVSIYPDDAADAAALLEHADSAMYRAKDQGRDGYRLYSAAMNAQALERLAMEQDVQRALAKKELLIYWQPTVEVAGGRIVGCRTDLRWMHPEKGLLHLEEFIELAETARLAIPIQNWMLAVSCRQVGAWQSRERPDLEVSLSLSPGQLLSSDLPQTVERALAGSGLAPRSLELGIPPPQDAAELERFSPTLERLGALGVRLAIDDFGRQATDLTHLRTLPIHSLSISPCLVADIHRDEGASTILEGVIGMGRSLGLGVMARGVAEAEQLRILRRLGCERAQGPLFGALGPSEQLLALIGAESAEALPSATLRPSP